MLGPLEADLSYELWRIGRSATLKRMWRATQRIRDKRGDDPAGQTTVQTTLDRLVDKRLLAADRDVGRRRYPPTLNRAEFVPHVVASVQRSLDALCWTWMLSHDEPQNRTLVALSLLVALLGWLLCLGSSG